MNPFHQLESAASPQSEPLLFKIITSESDFGITYTVFQSIYSLIEPKGRLTYRLYLYKWAILGSLMGWTHRVFATTIYLSVGRLGLYSEFDLPFFALLLGSIFPDIDHPRGMISSLNLFKDFSGVLQKATVHRGFIHSLLAAILFFGLGIGLILFLGFEIYVAIGFFFGYLSRLATDSLNPTGIKWLRPFHSRKLSWRISTGSRNEKLFFFSLIFLSGYLFLY
ncbi:MAG: metal-dependent hydrolase [Nitrososphaerales archaeon]